MKQKITLALAYVGALSSLGLAVVSVSTGEEDAEEGVSAVALVPAESRTIEPAQEAPSRGVVVDGVARPARLVELASPIEGLVAEVHPALELGGTIPSGDSIWQIEEREYAARLQAARQELAEALADARIEDGRARAAAREWEALRLSAEEISEEDRELALRVPQALSIEARIERLRSEVALAEIDRDRCTKRFDFDLEVISESVEPGAWIEQGQLLATGMRAGEWHIIARLTPAQAERIRALPTEQVKVRVGILGSAGEPVDVVPVRWLPGVVAGSQMRGMLLHATDVPGGALWEGAQVQVEFLLPDPNRRLSDAPHERLQLEGSISRGT